LITATTVVEPEPELEAEQVDTTVTVVYMVEMTEYERGWGQRPDGFLAFVDEECAKAWVADTTKDRTGPAPDIYVRYSKIGYKPCSRKFAEDVGHKGRMYVNRLSDLV
jgi:hypothetical protein